MKKKEILAFVIAGIVLLCGCGTQKQPETGGPASQEQQPGADGTQENDTEGNKAGETDALQEPSNGDLGDTDGTGEEGFDVQDENLTAPVVLSDEELQFFTEYIQKDENYGFLLSSYDSPEYVNLEEVFYCGAGIGEGMSDEEIAVYLEECQQEEIYTDCVKIPRENADVFLRGKLGIGLDEIAEPFAWVYLSEFDAYYHEAGDTNYASYDCVGGVREGDLYTLHFYSDWFGEDRLSDCETVIRKDKENYYFVSNHYLADMGSEYEAKGSRAGDAERNGAYAEALRRIMEELTLPDGTHLDADEYTELSENQFCIADVDGDEVEELLVGWTSTYVAGMMEVIYEYDPDTRQMRTELQEFPYVTFFDNGMILAGWSHNQTRGMDLWPYSMYRYNMTNDRYFYVGSVESWQKEVWPEGFPDEIDVSGCGTVYAIEYGEEYTGEYLYDQSQYDQFYDAIFGTAEELELDWHPLTAQEVDALSANP